MKRLASVETLGATSQICTDKTGTLTLNQMAARELRTGGRAFTGTGESYSTDGGIRPALRPDHDALTAMVLCADSHLHDGDVVGDPTEGALLVLAAKGGVDAAAVRRARPRLREVPFDAEYKFMARFHRWTDADGRAGVRCFVKGAPDVLAGRAARLPDRYERDDAELNQIRGGDLAALVVVAPVCVAVGGLAWRGIRRHRCSPSRRRSSRCTPAGTGVLLLVIAAFVLFGLHLPTLVDAMGAGPDGDGVPRCADGLLGGEVLRPRHRRARRGGRGVGVLRRRRWARTCAYAIVGGYLLIGWSVAGTAVTMMIDGDPDASVGLVAGFTALAGALTIFAWFLYRPLVVASRANLSRRRTVRSTSVGR